MKLSSIQVEFVSVPFLQQVAITRTIENMQNDLAKYCNS